ncbi:PQQ-binding-like beta-propeller repeat protein [candidate division WOR-3 bacterium]|nr:PQQ-binding-like beta-propeller repeat protein [candidate division WOR-3 bacterium]
MYKKVTRSLFVILILCFAHLQGAEEISEISIISAGIIVIDGASLRSEPNDSSEIIRELSFGIPFYILRRKTFVDGKRRFNWYKIKLIDSEIKGWAVSTECREGDKAIFDLDKTDLSGLYYSVGSKSLWRYNDYDIAEKIFLYILEKYPNRNIPIKEEIFDEIIYINGKLATCKMLAEVYKKKKDYQTSIKYYRKIMYLKEAERRDVAEAIRNIMIVYKDDLKDEVKTVDICHKIIKEFPDEEISGFEWNLWIDIEAARVIVDLYSLENEDIEKLEKECKRIIAETANPPVILIAMRGRIIAQICWGKFDLALKSLLEVIRKYPREIRSYFKTPVNFSISPLASAIEAIISEYGDYNKALDFAKTIKDSIQEEEIAFFTNYRIAQLLDEGNGSREQVISSYEKVSDQKIWFWDPVKRSEIGSSVARKRIKQIKKYEVEKATVAEENVICKPGLRSKTKNFRTISKGTEVKIIYKDRELIELDEKVGNWAKIMLPDGEIGWIFDGFLSLILKKTFFSPLKKKEQIWCMEGANSNRTSTIYGKKIKEPTLIKIIPNITSREVVFSDINDDSIMDIFANSPKGLVAIDGITHKVIWSFDCRNGSIPLIINNSVYIVAFVENGEYLFSLNKRTSRLVWKVLIGKRGHGLSPSSPAVDNDLIYVGSFDHTLLAVDIKKGKVVWKFDLSYPVVGAVTAANNLVYFSSREKFDSKDYLYALDALTGKLKWKFEFSPKSKGYVPGVGLEKGRLFCCGANGYLYALNAKTGDLIWEEQVANEGGYLTWFRLSIRKGVLYYATPGKEVYAINAKTGNIKWKYTYTHSLWGTPAIINDALYIRSIDSYIHAISLKDGKLLWKFKTDSGAYGGIYSPTVAQGLIFIGSTDRNLYIIGEGMEDNESLQTSKSTKIKLLVVMMIIVVIIGVYFLSKLKGYKK